MNVRWRSMLAFLLIGSFALGQLAFTNAALAKGQNRKQRSIARSHGQGDHAPSPRSLRVLRQDFEAGRISTDQYFRWSVLRLEAPHLMPERYRPIEKETFDMMGEAVKLMEVGGEVSPETRQAVRAISGLELTSSAGAVSEEPQPQSRQSAGSSCDSDQLQTANFDIHFSWLTNQAGDQNGVRLPSWSDEVPDEGAILVGEPNGCPDDVDRLALTMEHAWHKYGELGFDISGAPIEVSIETPAGGGCGGYVPPYNDDRIEIAPCALEDSYYLGRHEPFHVIQYNYVSGFQMFGQGDDTENWWWMEATADWAAKQVDATVLPDRLRYDDHVNDFLGAPSDPLITADPASEGRAYGAFLFAQTLQERFPLVGNDPFVRWTWKRMGVADYPGADQAIREAIGFGGTTVANVVEDFWRRTYHMSSNGGSWSDPDESYWMIELENDPRTSAYGSYGARPARDHRYIYEEYPQSNFDAVTVDPGGASFVDFETQWQKGTLTVSVSAADGRGFEESTVDLLPFANHPSACTSSPTQDWSALKVTFELALGGGCKSATLAMIQTTIDAEEESRSFNWTATFKPIYHDRILGDDPLGYWRLGETSGSTTASDSSGNGLDGTYSSGVALGKPGAVKFDPDTAAHIGDADSAKIPASASMDVSKLTAEAWVRTTTGDTTTRGIVLRGGVFQLVMNSGKVRASLNVNRTDGTATSFSLQGTSVINEGRWHHVAVTYDGTTARLWVDGQQEASRAETGAMNWGIGTGVTIGLYADSFGFKGDIDEVALYDHALTEQEIDDRFAMRALPKIKCPSGGAYVNLVCDSNPIGYWRLGEQNGTAAVDHTTLNDGRYGSAVTFGRPGAVDQDSDTAIATTGVTEGKVDISYEPYGTYAQNKLTAEAWVRSTSSDWTPRGIFGRGDVFHLVMKSGMVRALLNVNRPDGTPTSFWLAGTSLINDGRWHHVAVTYDGTTAHLYVDGLQQASRAETGTLKWGPAIAMTIGLYADYAGFNGDIDEVALYGHALPLTVLQSHYAWGNS